MLDSKALAGATPAARRKHSWDALLYVERNPVRAGLVAQCSDWRLVERIRSSGPGGDPLLDLFDGRYDLMQLVGNTILRTVRGPLRSKIGFVRRPCVGGFGIPLIRNYPTDFTGSSGNTLLRDRRGLLYLGTSGQEIQEYDGSVWRGIEVALPEPESAYADSILERGAAEILNVGAIVSDCAAIPESPAHRRSDR